MFKNILALAIFFLSSIEANSFGKGEAAYRIDGVVWNEVYFDFNKLHFTGFVPNYVDAQLPSDEVFIIGGHENSHYVISTHVFAAKIPKSGKEFKKLIQTDYPNSQIAWLDAKVFGAKFAVELAYLYGYEIVYARFIATNKHLIKLSTSDPDQARRSYFFNNFRIK